MVWHSIEPLLQVHDDPASLWRANPSYVVGEGIFFLMLVMLALYCGVYGRHSQLLFVACLTGGGCIELVTILHSEIGNFYHSQALVMMLGLREPFYMLFGCYGCLQFLAVEISSLTKMGPLAQAALAALLGRYLWACLDTLGLTYLWWTWHQDEPLYVERHNGVPVASTFWSCATIGAISYLLALASRHCRLKTLSAPVAFLLAALIGPLASIGLMNVPFLLIYHPLVTLLGLPAQLAMNLLEVLCAAIIAAEFRGAGKVTFLKGGLAGLSKGPSKFLAMQVAVYLLGLWGIILLFDPAAVVRSSFGQMFGDCEAQERSFWGAFTRKKYVCQAVPSRDQYQMCAAQPAPPEQGSEWYTVCGVPRTADFGAAMATNMAILVALTGFSATTRFGKGAKTSSSKKKS